MEINITVPSQLCDIKLHQYKKYVKLLETVEEGENRDSFVSLKMLEIFCNVPYQTAIKFKMQDVNKIIATILELLSSKNELVKRFRMGDTEFGFIPKLDDMTFGEYIDLDNYLGKWDNIEKAMAVLYRPITKSSQDLYDIADYQGDTYHEIMNEMPMDAVLSSIVFFLSFRDRIVTNYDELFTNQQGNSTGIEAGFGKKWGWYASVYKLAQSDVARIKDITGMNLHTCLLALCYEKDKSDVEAQITRNNYNKNKIRR